jgi:hypothetical protein
MEQLISGKNRCSLRRTSLTSSDHIGLSPSRDDHSPLRSNAAAGGNEAERWLPIGLNISRR